ncbi:MAG: four helix bundle protein [Bacteroidetes bacterium]|nr:four helix bundle protein [Bacteroidota bacterium]
MERDVTRVSSFRDLDVWKKSMELSVDIYRITQSFPSTELYGLTSQLRRAAVSVASNIAEGSGRHSTKEFLQFLNIANGSLAEIETHLELAYRLNYIQSIELQPNINHIRSMIFGLIRSLRKKL